MENQRKAKYMNLLENRRKSMIIKERTSNIKNIKENRRKSKKIKADQKRESKQLKNIVASSKTSMTFKEHHRKSKKTEED